MKNILYILLFLFCSSAVFAQIEDTEMDEMVIERVSKKNMLDIINNVKQQTYKNYTKSNYKYVVIQRAFIEARDSVKKTDFYDTLVNSRLDYDVSINLPSKKINKSKINTNLNKSKLNEKFFERYSGNDSPLYWLTEIVLRKYVNIPELDFFNNITDYQFDRMVKGKITTVSFFSENFYEGEFVYDEKYNLKSITFHLNVPYPIDHSQMKNGKYMFDKNWVYKTEIVKIKFKLDAQQKIYIDTLEAYEEIQNYNFKRYDSTGKITIEDKGLNFRSFLNLERK